jgi:hypothetical protein
MYIRKEIFMDRNKIEILKNIAENIELWRKYTKIHRIVKSYTCAKYKLKVTVWNHDDNRYEDTEIPLRGGIDWPEYFEKSIKEIEAKLDSLSVMLNSNTNEDEGTNTDTNKS